MHVVSKLRSRVTFANVAALLALFVALGGPSLAADVTDSAARLITGKQVKNGSLSERDLSAKARARLRGRTGPQGKDGPPGAPGKDGSPGPVGNAGGDLTGSYPNPLIAANAVTGAKVLDNTLTGADINESTLGTVTSSALGGIGRSGLRPGTVDPGPGNCDPESSTYINCNIVATLDLPAPARVLVIGSATAASDDQTVISQSGSCQLGTTAGPIPGTTAGVVVGDRGSVDDRHLSMAGVTGVFPAGLHGFGVDCREGNNLNINFKEARVTAVALSDR